MPVDDPPRERKVYSEKTKYRLWLVGNPDELGFHKKEDGTPREHWFSAITLSYMMLYHDLPPDEVFVGAHFEWIGDTFYFAESFPMGMGFTEAYDTFINGVKKAKKDPSGLCDLKLRHTVIEDFAIPFMGTVERLWFDRILRVFEAWEKSWNERSDEIQQHVSGILNALKR